jgi:hypothetical protein
MDDDNLGFTEKKPLDSDDDEDSDTPIGDKAAGQFSDDDESDDDEMDNVSKRGACLTLPLHAFSSTLKSPWTCSRAR